MADASHSKCDGATRGGSNPPPGTNRPYSKAEPEKPQVSTGVLRMSGAIRVPLTEPRGFQPAGRTRSEDPSRTAAHRARWRDYRISAPPSRAATRMAAFGGHCLLGSRPGIREPVQRAHSREHTCQRVRPIHPSGELAAHPLSRPAPHVGNAASGGGVHPKIVQERFGYSDISMAFNRYSHVTPHMQSTAASALEIALSQATLKPG